MVPRWAKKCQDKASCAKMVSRLAKKLATLCQDGRSWGKYGAKMCQRRGPGFHLAFKMGGKRGPTVTCRRKWKLSSRLSAVLFLEFRDNSC